MNYDYDYGHPWSIKSICHSLSMVLPFFVCQPEDTRHLSTVLDLVSMHIKAFTSTGPLGFFYLLNVGRWQVLQRLFTRVWVPQLNRESSKQNQWIPLHSNLNEACPRDILGR